MWDKQSKVRRVVDGDTIDVYSDLGHHTFTEFRMRLAGIDTWEVYGVSHDSEEYKRGKVHSEFVKDWIEQGQENWDGEWPFIVETENMGKYGRWLGTMTRRSDGSELTTALLNEFGEEVEYEG